MRLKKLLLLLLLVLLCCWLCFPLAAQPTNVGLLAHFKLTGNTLNTGPANVTATAINTTYTTNNAGTSNSALQFGGNVNSVLDFVDNGNLDFTGTNNFTISFSFFFNGSSSSGLIDNCLNYGGWGVWLWSTQSGVWNIQFNYKNNSVGSSAATAFTINKWHHVAAVRNNGTISIYIDGVFRLSATEGTMSPTYPINMIAGGMGYGGYTPPRYNPFGGKMDEIRIYNRALSAAEIGNITPYALPLTMGDFTAVKQSNGIKLNWETLGEQNTSHFEIERSSNGTDYTTIGTLNAAGNSSDRRMYSFLDNSPLPGTNFYRLKMVDIDRAFTHSRIIAVKNDNSTFTLQLFPNPAKDVLQVQVPSLKKQLMRLLISDVSGKIVYERNLSVNEGNNAISIPVQMLLPGTYQLTIATSENRQSKLFVRQE